MKNNLVILALFLLSLYSCQKQTNGRELMQSYFTPDSALSFNVPSNMTLKKVDASSILFEDKNGNNFLQLMFVKTINGNWNLESFSKHLIGNTSNLTLVEYSDSLIAYEIQNGMVRIPALMFSLYEHCGYSLLLTTMGVGIESHKKIGNSFVCRQQNKDESYTVYHGAYLKLKYPSNWILDNDINLQTTDVWIRQKNSAFGVSIFRIKNNEGVNFSTVMNEMANSWNEWATVDVSYENINNEEWCKHDIKMNIQGDKLRQISFYREVNGYIYNIKFGNEALTTQQNLATVDSIMHSVVLK